MREFSSLFMRYITLIVCVLFVFKTANALLDKPIATDSRIRTFVYSQNEVFRIAVHYGYQTNIEFADGEEIQTISVGNSYAWQLSPLGRRLFIKPLEENILTNMTLITNKRTYQFELQSKDLAGLTDDELVYVVRFFYPDENQDIISPETSSVVAENDTIPAIQPYNFDYKISGPVFLAPTKVFDDGINTYFKFPKNLDKVPVIENKIGSNLIKTAPKKLKDYILVNTTGTSFLISLNNQKVEIINNKLVGQSNGKSK
ncbi:MAG: Type IV secretory pathway, VirB9 components [Candidatus Midichloria mitochondrii]